MYLSCGKAGHFQLHCPELVGPKSAPQSTLFCMGTLSWGQGQEKQTQAFIDSGAAGTFVDAAWATNLNLPLVDLEDPIPIAAIEGCSLEAGVVKQ